MKMDSKKPSLLNPLLAPQPSGGSLLTASSKSTSSLGLLSLRQSSATQKQSTKGKPKGMSGKISGKKDGAPKEKKRTSKDGGSSNLQNPLLGVSTKQHALLSGSLGGNSPGKLGISTGRLGISTSGTGGSHLSGTSLLLTKPGLGSMTSNHLGGSYLTTSLTSSPLLGSLSSTKHSSSGTGKPYSTTSSSLFHGASARKVKAADRQGRHRDVPSTFEIPLPDYDFDLDDFELEGIPAGDEVDGFPLLDAEEVGIEVSLVDVSAKKNLFINSVSASLIGGPAFDNRHDATRVQLTEQVEVVVQHDPEFLLKVALYTRKELNIRSTANFLLALAANRRECRPYLKKYFKRSIALPSDWTSVAELYQTFHDRSINYGSLPTALRKVMVAKFPDFDQYQLAKYNKTKKKNKKPFAPRKPTSQEPAEDTSRPEEYNDMLLGGLVDEVEYKAEDGVDSDGEDEGKYEAITFTLKQLIRKLHITEPVDHVMSLLGKRYPEDLESFYQSKLPGTWESDKAGKRMKLPIPETWETQVSMKGNKASTWEDLIDHKKLPFMAMLRNLRNMIQAGIGPKYHSWVTKKLTDEGAVTNSKQFPFRFFSAYEVLTQMEKQLEKAETDMENNPSRAEKRNMARARGRGRGRGRGGFGRGGPGRGKPVEIKYDRQTLKRYRKALDVSVKIATCYNVTPIRGTTLLFCNVGATMNKPCTSAKGLGKPRTVLEIAVLLGLMCKYSCEECTMVIYGAKKHQTVDLEKGTILDNMQSILKCADAINDYSDDQAVFNTEILFDMLRDRVQIDNILILSDGGDDSHLISTFLGRYRRLVNSNLLFVNVDLSGAKCGVTGSSDHFQHPNDVCIAGYSDQILRFVAERGNGGQLNHVENIDKAFGLQSRDVSAIAHQGVSRQASIQPQKPLPILASQQTKRFRTARVFISSTFRDMHGERDLLTRFVFPELREKARKRYINLYEVDLRWGVTEEDTKQNKALEICLSEVSRCDYFIGILGERYGYVPNSYVVPDSEEFDWLKDAPSGRSVTELEILHAALNEPEDAVGRAFFYIRDAELVGKIPKHATSIRKDFEVESESARGKLEDLKHRLRSSGLEVYDRYPCEFGGVAEGHALANQLEEFGRRVINNLWNALLTHYPDEDIYLDEITHQTALHDAYMESHTQSFTGRKMQIRNAMETIQASKDGVVMVTGKSGCGKTAFMATLAHRFREKYQEILQHQVMVHFIGAAPGSGNLMAVLSRLCQQLKNTFGLRLNVPQDFKNLVSEFPEFLKRAAVHCGSYPLMIFIDGVDMMETMHQAKNMEWLPMNIPEDVIFVVSVQDNGQCHKALQRRQPTHINLGPLDLLDKASVVRSTLAVHRKALEETAFNNQMKLLVSKREANLPLFLSLACEELRVFGVFEQVSERLKAMSHTVASLLQEVLQRLEGDHDRDLVSTALVLLFCARDGLLEEELHQLLSLHQILGNTKYTYRDVKNIELSAESMMPQAVFAMLLRGLKGFLGPTGGDQSVSRLSLAHGEVEKAVRQRYMRGAAAELESRLHALLAGYFYSQADPVRNHTWSGKQVRPLSHLAYHLASANAYQDLESVLCSLHYIKVKCQLGLAAQLLEDYQAVGGTSSTNRGVQREREKFLARPNIQIFRSFVSRNLHILTCYPASTWQQAINEPSESPVFKAIKTMMASSSYSNRGLNIFEWQNKAETEESCMMTLTGSAQPVNCVSISAGDHFFASGSRDCSVKLYDMDTGKELKSFLGHSDAIISCCFVGRQRLVTAALDNTLSLWDVEHGHRIAVMKGHRRQVNHCSANASGTVIASASWDCCIKLWDGSSGCIKDTIRADAKPINCVAFHPEGKLIATGCWDATLKIWDSFNKKRVAILRGHRSSVRAVAYSPSGRHIASASLDGAVKLWSANTGTQVGSLTGHTQPINSLCYSANGQQLVTASEDHKVKVWSGTLGKQIMTFGDKNFSHATATSFSPSGAQVAVGYHDGYVRLYEVSSGAELFAVRHHEARVKSLRWCLLPGGKRLLLIGFDSGHVELLADNGNIVVSMLDSPTCSVTSVTYSQVNRLVAATFEDNSIYLWRLQYELKTGKKKTAPKPVAIMHATCNGTLSCSDLNKDGTRLVTASRDASIFVWATNQESLDAGGPYQPIISMHGCHKDWINACSWSDNADYLVTASNDFTLKLWDMKTKKEKYKFVGHTSAINSVAFAYGCVVSACFDGTVKVWSHKGVEITTLYGHRQRVNSCDIFVQSADIGDSSLDLDTDDPDPDTSWASMTATEEWSEEHQKKKLDKVSKVKIENVSVVTASDDGTVQLWKPLQGNEQDSLSGHSDRVSTVAISSKGQLVSGSLDKTVKLWRPKVEGQRQVKGHEAEVTCVAYSIQGNYAVSTGRDGQALIWHIPKNTTTTNIPEDSTAHLPKKVFAIPVSEKSVNAVCFMTNSKFAVGSDEGSVTVWSIEEPADAGKAWRVKLVRTITPRGGKATGLSSTEARSPITSIAYEPLSDTLYTGHCHLDWGFIVSFRGNGGKQLAVIILDDWVLHLNSVYDGFLVATTASTKIHVITKEFGHDTMMLATDTDKSVPTDMKRQPCWVTTTEPIIACSKTLLVGDSWGRLTAQSAQGDGTESRIQFQRQVHSGAVTGVIPVTFCGVVCTASEDGTLKLWTEDKHKQVGQFFCQAPVTCLSTPSDGENRGGQIDFMCGDKQGNVYFLDWH